jgi:hypothetical protein
MGQLYPNPISSTSGITIIAGTGLSGGGFVLLNGTVFLSATGGSGATRNAYTVSQTPNGSAQNFTIVNFPPNITISYADVFVNGIIQTVNTDYTLSNTGNLNFTFAPATGDIIDIVFSNPPGTRFQYTLSPAPNGVTTSFSFPTDMPTSAYVDVFVNGILQTPTTNYTLNLTAGTWSVVFTTAPATGDVLEAVFSPSEQSTRNLYATSPAPNGATTSFTITGGVPSNPNLYIDVFVNGIYQTIGTNFNLNLVSGVWNIVFTTAPLTGDIIETVF